MKKSIGDTTPNNIQRFDWRITLSILSCDLCGIYEAPVKLVYSPPLIKSVTITEATAAMIVAVDVMRSLLVEAMDFCNTSLISSNFSSTLSSLFSSC